MAARCGSRVDCPNGSCAVSIYFDGCGTRSTVACKSKDDPCQSDDDCKKNDRGEGTRCVYSEDSRDNGLSWACRGTSCQVGRPLTVEGAIHAARPISRDDWSAGPLSAAVLEDLGARAIVASHWLEIAAMEHASVASFARFALQLLSLGAPADLVADTHRAALDEIEHAKLAYAVARAYGGTTLGPAELAAAVAPLQTELPEIVRALVIEGCVGETWGAAEAALLAERSQAVLKRTLSRIARDELDHAALAYRSLRWLVQTFGAPAREAAQSALNDVAVAMQAQERPFHGSRVDLSAHGVLAAREAADLKRRALATLIRPLFAAMLTL
jgi:hypothetical protein